VPKSKYFLKEKKKGTIKNKETHIFKSQRKPLTASAAPETLVLNLPCCFFGILGLNTHISSEF